MFVEDRHLVARAREGDASAFAALLARHCRSLRRTCAATLRDHGAALDIAQDAALVAWLQLDRLRDPDRFGAWLMGIGRILSLRARRTLPLELTADGELPEPAADERNDPAARALAKERAHELAAAIGALPAGQREAVVLFHLAELPQAAVAARLNTGHSAVSTRLHKARAALRAHLEEQDPPMSIATSIRDIRRTPAGRHVVTLSIPGGELPIWIGAPEAEALVAELEGVELPRPHAHALALSLLAACRRSAKAVRICRLQDAIFYAEVVLDDGTAVDARPSDALVLAVAAQLPIELDRAVIEAAAAGVPDDYDADLADSIDDASVLACELRDHMRALDAELRRHR
jgi:uncharacterized protein